MDARKGVHNDDGHAQHDNKWQCLGRRGGPAPVLRKEMPYRMDMAAGGVADDIERCHKREA